LTSVLMAGMAAAGLSPAERLKSYRELKKAIPENF
jgi:hypothetical protein